MEFYYEGCVVIDDYMLDEMAAIAYQQGDIRDAIIEVAGGMDDYDYYQLPEVMTQVKEEVRKRMEM